MSATLKSAALLDVGTSPGTLPVIPVPMSSMSPVVKATIDAITHLDDSAAFHEATDFATPADIGNLIDSAPDALNNLNELAQALNDDANFGANTLAAIAAKADTDTVNTAFALKADTITVDEELALKADTDTVNEALLLKEDVVTVESLKLDLAEANNNFLLLLRWIITTFGQAPDGLESQIESALGAQ